MAEREFDHGELNIPWHRRRGPSLDAQIDRALAAQRREAEQKRRDDWQAVLDARAAEKVRPKMTAEEVRGARAIRDEYGWNRVVRVNTKTVTVINPWGDENRIPLDRVREVRS